MQMTVLDGYNVVKKLFPEEKDLAAGRGKLRDLMIRHRRIDRPDDVIYIVYDGKDGVMTGRRKDQNGIKTIFTSSGEEADDRIIDIIRHRPSGSRAIVISDDGKVYNGARAHGAEVRPPEYLLKKKPAGRVRINEARSKGSINASQERDIDKYYKKILGL